MTRSYQDLEDNLARISCDSCIESFRFLQGFGTHLEKILSGFLAGILKKLESSLEESCQIIPETTQNLVLNLVESYLNTCNLNSNSMI